MNIKYKPFRYSGNKFKLLKYFRDPPKGTKRIVEVFAGSCSYSLQYNLPIVAVELESRLVEVYKWLQSTTKKELYELQEWYNNMGDRFDIRDITELTEPQRDYIILNCGSLMTGHLNKNIIYWDCKDLPVENTINCLKKLKNNFTILLGDFRTAPIEDGDLIFMDPPYYSEIYNYYNQSMTHEELVEGIKTFVKEHPNNKIIFTYGGECTEFFPEYTWEYVKDQTVVKSRAKTQYSKREEYVAYINW